MVISAIQHSIMQIAPSQSVNDPSFSLYKWGDIIQIADALSRKYTGSGRNRAQKAPGIIFNGHQFKGNTDIWTVVSDTNIFAKENKMNPNK